MANLAFRATFPSPFFLSGFKNLLNCRIPARISGSRQPNDALTNPPRKLPENVPEIKGQADYQIFENLSPRERDASLPFAFLCEYGSELGEVDGCVVLVEWG